MPRTREQDRAYQREYRQRKAAESHLNAVPPAASADLAAVSVVSQASADLAAVSVVSQVQAELKALPQSLGLQASAAVALAMARVLDDPAAVPQHPAAAGQLRQIMAELRAAKAPEGMSKLAMIRGGRSA